MYLTDEAGGFSSYFFLNVWSNSQKDTKRAFESSEVNPFKKKKNNC